MERDARWDESNAGLVEQIRAEIARSGRITFADFMRQALYHPELGYYMTAERRPGREGDFLTAPEAHPIFGWTLARQIEEMWATLGRPLAFVLREYGAGSGTLARSLLDGLRRDHADLLESLYYEPVEINPSRREELAKQLSQAGFADSWREPRVGTSISGCILANEFVDAFPFHRVQVQGGQLLERYVMWKDGWFAEVLGPLSSPELADYFESTGIELVEGQLLEINLEAANWIDQAAQALERGYIMILDYGYPARELYGPERRGGTLKAYYQHGVHEDPFRAVGRQDLTAHVDFTLLERTAREAGLQVLGRTTQADFLAGAGIGDLLIELQHREGTTVESYLATRAAVARLIDPGGMGRFRVLVLGRDVPAGTTLRGLSFNVDRSGY